MNKNCNDMKEQFTIISDDLNHGIITEKEARTKLLILFGVSSSALKSDLLADIKMSCDGTYSDAIDDWDLVDTAQDVINRINKTVDKHYC